MEARGASNGMVAKEHAEIIVAGGWMLPTFMVVAIVGAAIMLASVKLGTLWVKIPLIIIGALIFITCIGSIAFFLWGRYIGFSWHFTKA